MSDALQQRYAEIERQYSQGQWQEVLSASAALLNDLPEQPGDPLRTRLSLLQGHTLLYGLGRIEDAAAIYRQVLASDPEAVLAAIAQQELDRCLVQQEAATAEPTVAPATGTEPSEALNAAFPFSAAPVGAEARPQQQAAMPWLEALGGMDPAPIPEPMSTAAQAPWLQSLSLPQPQPLTAEVIDEPDQIEVHRSDPDRAEVVDLSLPTAAETIPDADDIGTAASGMDPAEAEPEPITPVSTKPLWSPAEEAELARGLLTVVLR